MRLVSGLVHKQLWTQSRVFPVRACQTFAGLNCYGESCTAVSFNSACPASHPTRRMITRDSGKQSARPAFQGLYLATRTVRLTRPEHSKAPLLRRHGLQCPELPHNKEEHDRRNPRTVSLDYSWQDPSSTPPRRVTDSQSHRVTKSHRCLTSSPCPKQAMKFGCLSRAANTIA